MNCGNCKHWVFGRCLLAGSYITAEKLCNAWELSVSFDQAQKSNSAPEDITELKDTIVRLKVFIDRLIEAGESVAMEELNSYYSWRKLIDDRKEG